ncbi:MAG TPA: hypothetical protein VFR86_23425, partial [Burkholderiaceae bacterium]|nr:hypothetical protein [Burkholderiaceae bacterium]
MTFAPALAGAAAVAVLGGCAGTSIERQNRELLQLSAPALGAGAQLRAADEARAQARRRVAEHLAKPLTADDALRIALDNSPALQVLLAEHVASNAAAAQSARPSNPVFAFARLARGDIIEFERALSFSLLDVLTLPQRARVADATAQANTLRAAGDLVQLA